MSDALEVRRGYRLQQWARMVQECQLSGLSNREYCRQNEIPEKTYYYRLRQLRESVITHREQSLFHFFRSGSVTKKHVTPLSHCRRILPPWAKTTALAMGRPKP